MSSQPQETWIISEPGRAELLAELNAALGNSSASPGAGAATDTAPPRLVTGQIGYQFTRAAPAAAVAPEGQQTFTFLNASAGFRDTATLTGLRDALAADASCQQGNQSEPPAPHVIPLGQDSENSFNSFQPVLSADLTTTVAVVPRAAPGQPSPDGDRAARPGSPGYIPGWNKRLVLTYYPCERYWRLSQEFNGT
jgi:hypothetical protein